MKNIGRRIATIVVALFVILGGSFSTSFVQSFAVVSKSTVIIHYQKGKNDSKDWNIWFFPEGKEGKAYPFNGEDAFGKIATITVEGAIKKAGFIVRTDAWEKDGGDRTITLSGGEGEVWVKSGDEKTYSEPPDGEYRETPAYKNIDVTVHYNRYDGQYDGWNLWAWPEHGKGKAIPFTEKDAFGKVAKMKWNDLQNVHKVGMILRKSVKGNEWEQKEFGDRFITRFQEDGSAEVWIAQGQERVFYDASDLDISPKIISSNIDSFHRMTVETNIPFDTEKHGLSLSGKVRIQKVVPVNGQKVTNKVYVYTKKEWDLTKTYKISKKNFGTAKASIGKVVRSKAFDQRFFYKGKDLGNTYSKKKTSFKLWAPTAAQAELIMYDHWNDKKGHVRKMKRGEHGTWKAEVKGNQAGRYYTYKVNVAGGSNEAVDPYAKAVSVNGDKGAIIDIAKTNPTHFTKRMPSFSPQKAVIYELHVRDASIHPKSGIKHKGKYLGVAQENTTGPKGVKTGLNHIKDLGVTHVQLLPIYDYQTVDETKLTKPQYNWGYDPKNYNAPEGSYSTNPYKPAVRIKELKTMVKGLHHNNMRVIMDVVYNHMFSAQQSSFHKLVPGYYFRYNEDGTLSNGTGVGNDTASERKMMSKFIVDSVSYWAKEYNLDGFRFDLMGILDVKTMNAVRKSLNKIDPSIIVLGEGWDLNTPLDPNVKANQKNAKKMENIAHFNDQLRDGLKGSVFENVDKGFVNGQSHKEAAIKEGIKAGIDYPSSIASYQQPTQVISYVEAHDNLTLWDKLTLTNPTASVTERKQMHKLASSIVLTSEGISFIHAGQEFMRTKDGDHNSYKSSDAVNQLDWQRAYEFQAENNYVKGLIALRKTQPLLTLSTAKAIRKSVSFIQAPANTVVYSLRGENQKDLLVIHNANRQAVTVTLPTKGTWRVLVDGKQAGTKTLATVKGKQVSVSAISTFVLQRK
ncbi:pullulanase, type I [Fictibacillus macauensis ZFHKF-1]|uniref:pullulanase n=1 Tax=Fictibacillus macauensis ZFHKF-1 TaxID=1196324 RepID=I8UHZ3_9BACL|nr:type I pullulanase [Fictibacillus macauensis]EIT86495.1 pullulanase, type I [Fictibacillus macauensis ZFHKF-1]